MNWEECNKSEMLEDFLKEQKVKSVYRPVDKPIMFIEREDGKIVEFVPYAGGGPNNVPPGFMLFFFDSKEHYEKNFPF